MIQNVVLHMPFDKKYIHNSQYIFSVIGSELCTCRIGFSIAPLWKCP